MDESSQALVNNGGARDRDSIMDFNGGLYLPYRTPDDDGVRNTRSMTVMEAASEGTGVAVAVGLVSPTRGPMYGRGIDFIPNVFSLAGLLNRAIASQLVDPIRIGNPKVCDTPMFPLLGLFLGTG